MRPPTVPAEGSDWRSIATAVAVDVIETLTGEPTPDRLRVPLASSELQAWVLAACHVLWHPSLRTPPVGIAGLERLLLQELPALAAVTRAARLDVDEERREELVRRCVRAVGLRLAGESEDVADERLRQVDSIERHHLVRLAMERQESLRRAELLRRKAEEEAASKVSRE